jgi:hypothetical protein
MATYKHLRSSTANKRPTTSITDGQLAINTNTASPGLFFKDSAGTGIVKVGPVHVGTTAPNATPAAGGSSGNYLGEQWLDTSVSPAQMKVWNGSAWVGIVADELPVSKLQDGDARQLLQTDAAGTGVEWTSNVDVPGTLDVTSTATFDSIARHPLGSAAAPTLTFTGDTNTGIYSPGADQVAVATNGAGRLFVDASGNVGVKGSTVITTSAISAPTFQIGDGAGSPAVVMYSAPTGASQISFADSTTGTGSYDGYILYHQSSQYFSLGTASTERLRITSAGLVGIGTSSPGDVLHVKGGSTYAGIIADNSAATGGGAFRAYRNGVQKAIFCADSWVTGTSSDDAAIYADAGGGIKFYTNNSSTAKAVLTSGGSLGIGTTSPNYALHVRSAVDYQGFFENTVTGTGALIGGISGASIITSQSTATPLVFARGGTEAARIDSSGRLLVGTATARVVGQVIPGVQLSGDVDKSSIGLSTYANDTQTARLAFGKSRGASDGSYTIVQADDRLGVISFSGANGTDLTDRAAEIAAFVDGTPGANDMPGRLTFSTTADGASSPTERMRITSGGDFLFGKTTTVASDNGAIIGSLGQSFSVASQGFQGNGFHRNGDDGGIIGFFQDGTQEGSISVSGGTVSYNGAHLSRWSQLASGAERIEILRGSVLSNLDEMCEWGEEENEQLNRMKMSDVEGDKNVSGVFQAWDDDDDTYINDFYCAMTGDFIIRIGDGVTVERGDLLMSAGDGTAKPQDDDIIRSKTIAKVTSTNVSCTYDDGSYCVPCVLMAC